MKGIRQTRQNNYQPNRPFHVAEACRPSPSAGISLWCPRCPSSIDRMRAKLLWCGAVASLVAGCFLLPAAPPASIADLRRAFEEPPADARIMVRWWWFGPAFTNDELERELRTMKEGGIGGVEVQPVYPLEIDNPEQGIRNLPYLSDGFLEALRFTGEKTRELGLRFDLTLGSGWPFGGPHIPITQAAGLLRIERLPVPAGATSAPPPALAAGESLIASFPDPDHARTALVFISSHTRMMVKRAAVGAEGFVLDHYDRTAISTHLHAVGDRLAQAFGKNPPHAVFSDSLEVERSDWRSEEHTSELQSLRHLVCRLLLEKKTKLCAARYLRIT